MAVDPESVDRHAVRRRFLRIMRVRSHPEGSRPAPRPCRRSATAPSATHSFRVLLAIARAFSRLPHAEVIGAPPGRASDDTRYRCVALGRPCHWSKGVPADHLRRRRRVSTCDVSSGGATAAPHCRPTAMPSPSPRTSSEAPMRAVERAPQIQRRQRAPTPRERSLPMSYRHVNDGATRGDVGEVTAGSECMPQ